MMMDCFFDKVADSFVQNGVVCAEEKELYVYGLRQGAIIIWNIITTVFIGVVFGMVWKSLAFLAAYIPLRVYAGGYHAKTQLRCYVFSILMIIVALFFIKLVPWTQLLSLGVAVVAGLVLFFLAPVEDHNKPLDETEEIVYKKKARHIFVLEVCGVQMCFLLKWDNLAICIAVALGVLAEMLILGQLKNQITH